MNSAISRSSDSRRPGSLYTHDQRTALEEYYGSLRPGIQRDSQKKLRELSTVTGLSRDQIQMWLRNRRTRGAYKGRAVHNVHQVRVLEWLFTNYSQYPSSHLKKQMSEYLEMSYAQFQKWFQTRRQRSAPALLAHHAIDEEEWQNTLKDVREIIEKASSDEYTEIDRAPKKRKIEWPIERPSSSSSPDFSPKIHHSEGQPSVAVVCKSMLSLLPQPRPQQPPPIEVIPPTPIQNPFLHNNFRLPSFREILQEITWEHQANPPQRLSFQPLSINPLAYPLPSNQMALPPLAAPQPCSIRLPPLAECPVTLDGRRTNFPKLPPLREIAGSIDPLGLLPSTFPFNGL